MRRLPAEATGELARSAAPPGAGNAATPSGAVTPRHACGVPSGSGLRTSACSGHRFESLAGGGVGPSSSSVPSGAAAIRLSASAGIAWLPSACQGPCAPRTKRSTPPLPPRQISTPMPAALCSATGIGHPSGAATGVTVLPIGSTTANVGGRVSCAAQVLPGGRTLAGAQIPSPNVAILVRVGCGSGVVPSSRQNAPSQWTPGAPRRPPAMPPMTPSLSALHGGSRPTAALPRGGGSGAGGAMAERNDPAAVARNEDERRSAVPNVGRAYRASMGAALLVHAWPSRLSTAGQLASPFQIKDPMRLIDRGWNADRFHVCP
ncbi:hypothetical protein WME90_25685 [Sorangium sp. So ce375]|uniref:hypothetical protein n=1 Tax=Sorangium sp. So ce375 TaxID=3133306 RepID=UPI003F5C96C0